MDKLPSLVMIKIFKFLSFKDRLRSRLVCKSWRNKIKAEEDQQSLFFHFDSFPHNIRDSYSNELIKYENSIRLKSFRFLRCEVARMYFKNLKKMTIFNIEQYELNVWNLGECVNHFTKLEILSLIKLKLKEKTALNLSELQVLVLKNVRIEVKLELNTRSLDTLICWSNLDKIHFLYPSNLINLEYKDSSLDFNQKFQNLESLKYFNETGLKNQDFLGDFKKLRNLVAYTPFVEHDLKEFKKQKQHYKMEKLEISSFGFRDEFIYFPINHHYIYLLDRFKLKELFNNYSKLIDNVSFPVQIDFCSTIDYFTNIPNDFFKKFTQITQVNVCWNSAKLIENFSSLINFIENCGFLPKLMLNNCAFKQNFYDQLCLHSSIGQLEIKESNLHFDSHHFLSSLMLFHLKVHLNSLPVSLLRQALLNETMKYFEFHHKHTKIYVKFCRNSFDLEFNNLFVDRFDNLESLIYHLQNDHEMNHLLC